MQKIVILIGAPGSGKGTQSKFIKEYYKLAHISTGDMLREEITQATDLGKKIDSLISGGNLVDNETMNALIESRITKEDCKDGFILDGYPRTLKQANMLEDLFKKYSISNYKVIEINVDQDILIKRIIGRYTCSSCGFIYNEFLHNPKIKGVCDNCGSTSFDKRADDNLETLTKRLDVYNIQSAEILPFYENKKIRYIIDGTLSIEESKKEIINIIDKH
jgi:adenylate kinase